MAGFELAFKGRSLSTLPPELLEAIASSGAQSIIIGVRRSDPKAIKEALIVVANPEADNDTRAKYLQTLAEVKHPEAMPVLLKLISNSKEQALHSVTLAALQQFDAPEIGAAVVRHFEQFTAASRTAALSLLACRASWSLQLLEAVEAGKIDRSAVDPDTLARIKTHKNQNQQIASLLKKHWANERVPTTAEMQKEIQHYAHSILAGTGDPYEGRNLFRASCGSCHKLFAEGGQIGPDLTPYKRDDLETTLLNIVNPNAEIREGYENHYVTTKDGRTLSGFLADKDKQVIVIRGIDGASMVLPQTEIEEMRAAGVSLMPEGLLSVLKEQQVRDLFAYLRSTQPLIGQPPPRLTSSKTTAQGL